MQVSVPLGNRFLDWFAGHEKIADRKQELQETVGRCTYFVGFKTGW